MELKLRKLDAVEGDSARSNRTFMELKFLSNRCPGMAKCSSNRTFMELKLSSVTSTSFINRF